MQAPSCLRWTLRQVPEVQGGLVAMDVNSGRVLAMQGGFSYQDSVFNRATQARRQPGSSFKAFVYAAALTAGFSPATLVNDAPVVFESEALEGIWRPENYSQQFYGPTRLREGMVNSRNLVSIRVLQSLGQPLDRSRDRRADLAKRQRRRLPHSRFGVVRRSDQEPFDSSPQSSQCVRDLIHPGLLER